MNPIQPPHDVGGQMDRSAALPVLVNVVAHFLDPFGNEMCPYWFVLTSFNFYARRPEVTGKHANAGECLPMQAQDEGWSQLEFAPVQCGLDDVNTNVVLSEAITGFSFGFGARIGDQLRLESLAIPFLDPACRHQPLSQAFPP